MTEPPAPGVATERQLYRITVLLGETVESLKLAEQSLEQVANLSAGEQRRAFYERASRVRRMRRTIAKRRDSTQAELRTWAKAEPNPPTSPRSSPGSS